LKNSLASATAFTEVKTSGHLTFLKCLELHGRVGIQLFKRIIHNRFLISKVSFKVVHSTVYQKLLFRCLY